MNDTIVEQRLQTTHPASLPLRPPTFPSADVAYVVDDTPVGRILFARNEHGALVASRYVADDRAVDSVLDRLATRVSPRVIRLPSALDGARRLRDRCRSMAQRWVMVSSQLRRLRAEARPGYAA